MPTSFNATAHKKKLEAALARFVARLAADRYILAAVQVGSFADEVLWRKETIHLWIIEEDAVSRRLRSDGEDVRIFRTFVEDEVNIHAEVIPRSRFKLMVEGSSRTAFSCSFFARRKLVHCADPSIATWFEKANELATKDQNRELLAAASWVLHAAHHARKCLDHGRELHELQSSVLWIAHGLAAIAIIERGEVCEIDLIERALTLDPKLFTALYTDVLRKAPDAKQLKKLVEQVEKLLERKFASYLEPLLAFLRKQKRVVPASEIADFFAHTQLYPGHLEQACEWLARHHASGRGTLLKLSSPFRLTRKSRVELEEPAYLLEE